jgi:mono/diheme cytochrome c family protein
MIRRPFYFGIVCMLALMGVKDASMARPVDNGRKLALEVCSSCHQVASNQKRPEPVAEGQEGARTEAPSFMEIADHCFSAGELKARIANPHYPMREQVLMPIDLEDLSQYIQSLSRRTNCAIR